LNIGSFNEERFAKGARTDFFEHFAAIVSICIENLLNMHRLKRQGLTDTLTAVNNRRFFDQRLREEIEVVKRSKEPLSCMMLDADHFKCVNDTYGHQVGDYVLRELASIIRAQLRGSDVLARYGGEEFSVLLAKTPLDVAQEVAERIRRSVADYRFTLASGESFTVTLSVGIAALEPAYTGGHTNITSEWLIGHSDRCLYEAKRAGRNCIHSCVVTREPELAAQCA
jgi:diguanylate cyclase (GGDEF)-like protein